MAEQNITSEIPPLGNPWTDPQFTEQSGGDKTYHDLLARRHIAHLSLLHVEGEDQIEYAGIMDDAVEAYERYKDNQSKENDGQ